MKMRVMGILVLLSLLLILAGCAERKTESNTITGNVVKEPVEEPNKESAGLDPNGLGQVCGSYTDNFKKICECLGDLEKGNDGNYYCKGTCGFDCTCFRDRRVVACPSE